MNDLCFACSKGDLEAVQYLVSQGADVNFQDKDGKSPLIWACINNKLEIIRMLSEEERTGTGNCITRRGNLELVQYLVSQGADVNFQDKDGKSPLIWACIQGLLDVVQYLVSQGAHTDVRDNYGGTPIVYAWVNRHTEIAQYLVNEDEN